MSEIIYTIVLSLLSSFCYDGIKTIILNQKENKKEIPSHRKYTKKYIRAVKKEFYVSLPLGIVFLYFYNGNNSFLDTFRLVMSGLMFFICIMSFACAIEIINNTSNNDSNND